jgi:hypothetical protein
MSDLSNQKRALRVDGVMLDVMDPSRFIGCLFVPHVYAFLVQWAKRCTGSIRTSCFYRHTHTHTYMRLQVTTFPVRGDDL